MTEGLARFLYRFARPTPDLAHEREILFAVQGQARPATLYLPASPARSHPGWVLLQGITVPGRHHVGVRRMARALAASGHLALVPEVPAWTALRVDLGEAEPTIRGALEWLRGCSPVDPHRLGLMAFSVAATWALEVAAGELGRQIRLAVSLGGYGDVQRMLVAMVTGDHEWHGEYYHHRPDPYGRWILGAALLPQLDHDSYGAQGQREAAARALHQLAFTAGRNGAKADTPVYDDLIGQLRDTLPQEARPAWDLLAPPSQTPVPERSAGRDLAEALAQAAIRTRPAFAPQGRLASLTVPTILLHGRGDRLIPFTETLRLAGEIPPAVRKRVTITRLVGHAKLGEEGLPRPLALAHEARDFAGTVRQILAGMEP